MVTVKDIAKMCNVSPSTVSNILNGRPNVGEETRERVMKVVQEVGYHPNYFASAMRKQNSKSVCIVVEDLNQFTTNPIVVAIMAYCEDRGYRTFLINLRMYDRWKDTWYRDRNKLLNALLPALQEAETLKVDGVIYVAGHARELDIFPEDFEIPIVIAYAAAEQDRYPSVLIDDIQGGYDMGKYLVSMGHRKIGIVTGVERNLHTKYRLNGFQKALMEEGVLYNPQCTFHGNWQRESGYRLGPEVLAADVTVVWCMNDQMAAGVYDYLYENGRVPGKDISVAGFDNMDNSSYMYPRLTTNEIQFEEIGKRAAECLIRTLEEDNYTPAHQRTWVPCKMIYGKSVVRPGE